MKRLENKTDIVKTVLYITRGVEQQQPRFIQRGLRQNASVRKYVTTGHLSQLLKKYVPVDCPTLSLMKKYIEQDLPTDAEGSAEQKQQAETESEDTAAFKPVTSILPEVEVYIFTLIVTTLLRHNRDAAAAHAASALVDRIKGFNRRSMDMLSSKAYFYLSLAYEKLQRLEYVRPTLLQLYRTACIRHDEIGQAVLLNLILRNYLHYNLLEQAQTLSLRASFPESASNNQFCRYLYYMGRIQAIQLEYGEAYQRLIMAARKAPQSTVAASSNSSNSSRSSSSSINSVSHGHGHGFVCEVNKLAVIVQLLMGDIPERGLFNQPELRQALAPYLALTLAVRAGDLVRFNAAVSEHKKAFVADKNFSLVQRLGHNVLKTGLRKLNISYSRISLQDIAAKLHLPSAAAAEYICAKAIRDGVIGAKIDHESGWLISDGITDQYSSEEPQKTFHKRITFCLDVHNEAVKSMRYPPDTHYKKAGSDSKKKGDDKKEEKTIEELIKEFEEEEDDM